MRVARRGVRLTRFPLLEGTAHGERPALNTGFVSKEDGSIPLPSATGRRRRGGASPASKTGGSKEQVFDSPVFRHFGAVQEKSGTRPRSANPPSSDGMLGACAEGNWRVNRTGCGLVC